MDVTQALPLLGGLTPQLFMRRHWHKKPLLIRQAIPGFVPPVDRTGLFALAAGEDVESRLVIQGAKGWQLRHGPFERRAFPPLKQPGWTVLVQGVDLHDQSAHALLNRFRFVPDARLDDLMISYATDGGGVGPHFDSYDVFLLQAHGRRRWRIGRQSDPTLVEGLPIKSLAHFVPEEEFVLEPGDMLYLPPRWAHDGIAEGECITYSIGFRSPARSELARELLQRLAEDTEDTAGEAVYRDPSQSAVETPGALPEPLVAFAQQALQAAVDDPQRLRLMLGEYLTEPKPRVWFEPRSAAPSVDGVVLDRCTRMLYDARHIFINGEGYRAAGRDATLMRRLTDERRLTAGEVARLGDDARELLRAWIESGWVHGNPG
jgi:50S ribosomal protein L16 3-hydroxylase